MKRTTSKLLPEELGEHEYTIDSFLESRPNSTVYVLRYQGHETVYAEVFHKDSCFRSLVGSHAMKNSQRIVNEFGTLNEGILILPVPLTTKNFFTWIWRSEGFFHPRFNLYEYLKSADLDQDQRWNLISEIFRIVWNFARKGISFKHLPFERIFIQGKKIVIDAFEFMELGNEFKSNFSETINHFLFDKYANEAHLSIIAPEVFLRRKITQRANSWIMGNLIFFVFEVD
jgi:hypothetical protein